MKMLLTMCSDCVINSTSFGWGKGGNVTSVGWQVTLCDPVWYVSSRSGVSSIARGVARRLIKSTCSVGQIHGALSCCCSKVHCRLRMWHCQNSAILRFVTNLFWTRRLVDASNLLRHVQMLRICCRTTSSRNPTTCCRFVA